MKRVLLAATVVTVALSGCAELTQRSISIDATRPQIRIVEGNRLVVNQEPIHVPRSDRTVTWQLPRGVNAQFDPQNGITVDRIDKLVNANGSPIADRGALSAANERLLANARKRDAAVSDKRQARILSVFPCTYVDEFEYSCLIPQAGADTPHGLYAYTIRVNIDGKPYELDPRMMP